MGPEPRRNPRRGRLRDQAVGSHSQRCADAAIHDRETWPGRVGPWRDGQSAVSPFGLEFQRRFRDGGGRLTLSVCAGLPLGRGRAECGDPRSGNRRGDAADTRAVARREALRTEETSRSIADQTFTYRSPIIEVFLDNLTFDEQENALIAPPWSSVPWHVLALMEAAVERGIAAFSRGEAERLHLPWLDLVRDPEQLKMFRALIKE